MKHLKILTITLLIALALLIAGGLCDAQTVSVSASVAFTNCNIAHSYIPPPTITHTWENEYGFNFMGHIGDNPFWALRSEDRLDFYLDDAHWWTDGVEVYYGECDY